MRQSLTVFLFIFSATTYAQVGTQNDSISFCSYNFKVPDGCTSEKNSIKCDNFEMTWSYMDEVNLKGVSDKQKLKISESSFMEFCNMLGKFKRKRITCYVLDTKVKGYKVTYTNMTGANCIIYASGVINGRAVTTMLILKKEVNTNDDIPEFPRQIIKLTLSPVQG